MLHLKGLTKANIYYPKIGQPLRISGIFRVSLLSFQRVDATPPPPSQFEKVQCIILYEVLEWLNFRWSVMQYWLDLPENHIHVQWKGVENRKGYNGTTHQIVIHSVNIIIVFFPNIGASGNQSLPGNVATTLSHWLGERNGKAHNNGNAHFNLNVTFSFRTFSLKGKPTLV